MYKTNTVKSSICGLFLNINYLSKQIQPYRTQLTTTIGFNDEINIYFNSNFNVLIPYLVRRSKTTPYSKNNDASLFNNTTSSAAWNAQGPHYLR